MVGNIFVHPIVQRVVSFLLDRPFRSIRFLWSYTGAATGASNGAMEGAIVLLLALADPPVKW